MSKNDTCPSCRATWLNGVQSCIDSFNTLLAWELDNGLYDVHHLLVLCFNVQHPENYSPEALTWAQRALVEFLETDLTPAELRQRAQRQFDPANRTHRIKGTRDSHGSYITPVNWSMHVANVVTAGLEGYYSSIHAWGQSIYKDLLISGNLPTSAQK